MIRTFIIGFLVVVSLIILFWVFVFKTVIDVGSAAVKEYHKPDTTFTTITVNGKDSTVRTINKR